jgi:hypothetical protein
MSNHVYRSIHWERNHEEGEFQRKAAEIDPDVRQMRRSYWDRPLVQYYEYLQRMREVESPSIRQFWRKMMHGDGLLGSINLTQPEVVSVIPIVATSDQESAIDVFIDTLSQHYTAPDYESQIEEESMGMPGGGVRDLHERGLHSMVQYAPIFYTDLDEAIIDSGGVGLDLIANVALQDGVGGAFHPGYGIVVDLSELATQFERLKKKSRYILDRWVCDKCDEFSKRKGICRECTDYDDSGGPIEETIVRRKRGYELLNDQDWKNLWLLYNRFILTHEAFHYWRDRVAFAHYKDGASGELDEYLMRISRCSTHWDRCCYNGKSVEKMDVQLNSSKGVERTKVTYQVVDYCGSGDCGQTGHLGYQYPLEEALANAFALRNIDQRIRDVYADQKIKKKIVRKLVRSPEWLSYSVGYCHGDEFSSDYWFKAGLRDLSSLISNPHVHPPDNLVHDLRIRKWITAEQVDMEVQKFGGKLDRGLFDSVKVKDVLRGVPIKVIGHKHGSSHYDAAKKELIRTAEEVLEKIDSGTI